MDGERRSHFIEECLQLADEAKRMAEKPGISSEEKADLLEVERGWLTMGRTRRFRALSQLGMSGYENIVCLARYETAPF
jgi:hypothetical protein